MRRFLAIVSLVLLPALLAAEDKKEEKKVATPNTLTKEEVADGWLLLFDGETKFGWKATGVGGEPSLVAKDGALLLTGRATVAEITTKFPAFELACEYRHDGKGDGWLSAVCGGRVFGNVLPGGKGEKWGRVSFRIGPDRRFSRVEPPEGKARVSEGKLESPLGDSCQLMATTTGEADSKLYLRSVKLRPLDTKPLFNGKDLTGWNLYKGDEKRQKSKFTVTKEGWLNVKDGAGDLQTEKKYDDFVLQLECISNGKHLNSGIFFRCLPGEYQQGYEAQIRNEFKDKASQKYTVEEYDPKTNKLTGKKEVTSPAVDYGTGAIYRRMPARKQVSKDNEWFRLTVVARERHFATWVNGIQQVDWTDNRPVGKNAREGYYADAGCISIQGHDPTTDLSFRNLRISPLPRPKKKE